jgi:hypothetical protein
MSTLPDVPSEATSRPPGEAFPSLAAAVRAAWCGEGGSDPHPTARMCGGRPFGAEERIPTMPP